MIMPSSKKCVDLHLARSFDELNKKSEIKKVNFSVDKAIQSTERLWLSSRDEELNGNEEKLYMYLYRIVSIYLQLDKKDYDVYKKSCGLKLQQAMAKLEALKERLQKRYEEKTRIYEERRVEVLGPNATQESKPVPGLSVRLKEEEESIAAATTTTPENWYEEVTPTQLHEKIKSLALQAKLLVVDIREAADFNFSNIAANKFKVPGSLTVVNIPGSKIRPSLTCAQLMKNLAFGMGLDALERRRSFNHVVIIDEHTFQFEKTSKSVILADALWKWDQSPDRIKAKPLLMCGGFYKFILTYPQMTSNAAAIAKYSSMPISPNMVSKSQELSKMCYNFNENGETINDVEVDEIFEDDTKMVTPPEEDDKLSEEPMDTTSQLDLAEANKPLGRLYNFGLLEPESERGSFGKTNNLNKVPGLARPVIPDRASKPKSFLNGDVDGSSSNGESTNPINIGRNLKPTNGYQVNGMETEDGEGHHSRPHRVTFDHEDEEYDNGAGKFDDDEDDLKAVWNKLNHANNNNMARNGNLRRIVDNGSDGEEEEEEEMMETESGPRMMNGFARSLSKPIDLVHASTPKHNHNGMPTTSTSLPQSSLSRSLSSPNIAQFGQEHPLAAHSYGTPKQAPPLIDRSMKPTYPMLAHLYRKSRDFSPQWSTTTRVAGLRNLGNTCFMNSMLQCLNNTSELSDYMKITHRIHLNEHSKFGTGGELAFELGELFKQMSQNNYKHLSPKDFKNAVSKHIPDFIDYKQQDAHEFLVRLLDRLHADMNVKVNCTIEEPTTKDPNYYDNMAIPTAANSFWKVHRMKHCSIITDLFEGLIVSTLKCLQCNYTSKTLEPFTCLGVPVLEGGRCSLKGCIANLLRPERMSDETAWQCPTCKLRRDAEKSTIIWRLPTVLVIHLKRFTYEGLWRTKINTFVDFPIESLSIAEATGQNRAYNLYGVVNHMGSLEGGHYTAYSRNIINGQVVGPWHKFDDADVMPISLADVITQNAYVLFYRLAQ